MKKKTVKRRDIFRHKKPIIEVLEDSGVRRGGQWGVPLSSLFDIRPIFIVSLCTLTIYWSYLIYGITVTPIPCARFHQLPWDFQVTYINTVFSPVKLCIPFNEHWMAICQIKLTNSVQCIWNPGVSKIMKDSFKPESTPVIMPYNQLTVSRQ